MCLLYNHKTSYIILNLSLSVFRNTGSSGSDRDFQSLCEHVHVCIKLRDLEQKHTKTHICHL